MLTSAASTALGINELLAIIIQKLDTSTFSSANAVSWQWHCVTQALIATNATVKRKLFLTPATPDEVLNLGLAAPNSRFIEDKSDPVERRRTVAILNPFLFRQTDSKTDVSIMTCSQLLNMGPQRKAMYLAQPPPSIGQWSVCLGKRMDHSRVEFLLDGTLLDEGHFVQMPFRSCSPAQPYSMLTLDEIIQDVEQATFERHGFAVDWSDTQLRLGEKVIDRECFDRWLLHRPAVSVAVSVALSADDQLAWLSRGHPD